MSILQEYEQIKKRIGAEKFAHIEKVLKLYPHYFLSDVYYKQSVWNEFEKWENENYNQQLFWDDATEKIYTLDELKNGYEKTTCINEYFKNEYPTFNNYLMECLSKNGTLKELDKKTIVCVKPLGWGIYADKNGTQYIILTNGKLENQDNGNLYLILERNKNEEIIKIIEW